VYSRGLCGIGVDNISTDATRAKPILAQVCSLAFAARRTCAVTNKKQLAAIRMSAITNAKTCNFKTLFTIKVQIQHFKN